jgi:hypothetical protein
MVDDIYKILQLLNELSNIIDQISESNGEDICMISLADAHRASLIVNNLRPLLRKSKLVVDSNKLQKLMDLHAHYARLLNDYDGGKRIIFRTFDDWSQRLDNMIGQAQKAGF